MANPAVERQLRGAMVRRRLKLTELARQAVVEDLNRTLEERKAEITRLEEALKQEISSHRRTEEELRTHQIELQSQNEELRRTQRSLDASRDNYAELYDRAPVAYFSLDVKGTIVQANLAAASLLGIERGIMIGKPLQTYVLYDDRETLHLHCTSVLESREKRTCEIRLLKQNGDQLHVLLESRAALDLRGNSIGVRTAAIDITARKKSEDALKESEIRFRAVVQTAPDAIISIDRQGRVVLWNNGAEEIFGYSPNEIIGKPLTIVMPERFREAHLGALERAVRDRKARVYPKSIEVVGLRKDGEEFPAAVSLASITLAEGPLFTGILRDISEQKNAQEALRQSEERYRSLFDESTDGIFVITEDGRVEDANRSLLETLGYTWEELSRLHVRDLYANPTDKHKLREQIVQEGFVKDFPLKAKRKDGKEIDCLLTAAVRPMRSGVAMGYQGILRDVTDQRRLEKQLQQAQKMEAIGALAGGIAHDFNNLLTVILGYSDLLLVDKGREEPGFQELQAVRQAAQRGTDLVKQILAFSRKLEASPRPTNLNHAIQQAQSLLSRSIPKMIGIDLRLADNLHTVNADSGQVEQVLLNLVVNSRDAIPATGGKIVIETRNAVLDKDYCDRHVDVTPGNYALISVSDTGHGMTQDVLDRIFEPFYTTKEPGRGTGLGLAMVFGIVKAHNGHITCYSEPGVGTTFNLYFPATLIEEDADVTTTRGMPASGTETILLADDEEYIRALGTRLLTRAGYTVLTAGCGNEALDVYRKNKDRIALVILDLIMPQMGGKECLEKLLALDPKVKVLIASGYAVDRVATGPSEQGARGFIAKPYNMERLLQVVREVLDAP
ncbi:MAG: PAS domain S-box protein [Thermodesulfobacteriota bacterium]